MDAGLNIRKNLGTLFSSAVKDAFPSIKDPLIVIAPSSGKFPSDYQCNSALSINAQLKTEGIKTNPRDVALKIIEKIANNNIIKKTEVAGPGFINIWLSETWVASSVKELLIKDVEPPKNEAKQKIIVDFSAPNIAKEMHVGHLRSTIIGESIARLFEYLGHDVLRINHIGDWGTQFGMLIAHLQDRFPDYVTVSPPIADLQAFYKESKQRFDEDPEFKKRAYSCVVKLQSFEPESTKAWQLICDVSRKEFQKIYDRLDIKLIERGESFYQTRMEKLAKQLKDDGILEEDDGRYVLWGLNKSITIPMIVIKSDGGFTYDTSDLAALKQRIEEEKAERIIYVTDQGQETHFMLLKSCAEKIGYYDPSKVRFDHVGFGAVLGEDKKKFKTRSGESVRLIDLLDEGIKRAEAKLEEKGRRDDMTPEEFDIAKTAVAYGCIKYADLSHNRVHEYVFSFDKMLDDKGNTAVYLLYAYTRIRSIARNAKMTPEQLKSAIETTAVAVEHEKEWKLAKILLKFYEVIDTINDDLCPHHLCEYLYDVACCFTEFYDKCYCIEKDSTGEIKVVHTNRILLCEATAQVMSKCFHLLGLKTVSKM
ncbi:unnamed protein product [Bemisia tabaci]|uniref:Probable arginine--tRNA ligase, cytoplasmic n=1 Tax=Bemisia tabaci TaxID=7038 RepID=A0A9P0ABE0_BEMTA|nr:unnamed protein product [Bemisia tabaci]